MRRLRPLLPIFVLIAAYAVTVQASGNNQSAHYALVKALDAGTPKIDRWQLETVDKSYTDGHYYSVKAPGLAFAALPWYAVNDALGVIGKARSAGSTVSDGEVRTGTTQRAIALSNQRAETWLLGLWVVLLPALALLLIVRSIAERFAPGLGTLTAVGLGTATIVLPYSTMLYAHVPAAALVFGAFWVLLRERDGLEGDPRLLALAGLLGGLAALVDYPVALIAVVLGLYAMRRSMLRGLAYAAGAIVGIAPLLAYNVWAFGSITHLSYDDAVAVEGVSGHDVLGLNDEGFFGISAPDPGAFLDLLLAPKGLLTLTPVVLAAAWGVRALFRRGLRAEALTITGVVLVSFLYNAGYYLPFGGDVPGPRFLTAMLPFLAIGGAVALRERPGPTVAFGGVSVAGMVIATMAEPQSPAQQSGLWWDLMREGDLQYTLFGALGVGHGWLGILPFLALVVAALVLAVRDAPALGGPGAGRAAAIAVAAWVPLAIVGPRLVDDSTASALALVALGVVGGAGAAALALRERPSPQGLVNKS